jgi:putative peptidoglycan lipid II flippase
MALVAGLPAYVIVKILNPGFFAREDTRTPVWTALVSLLFNIALNLWVVRDYGIVGLAAATACSATLNCLLLYLILHRRGWFHFSLPLANKIARQLIATVAMAAALWWLTPQLTPYYAGLWYERAASLALLVGTGLTVFFTLAYAVGAIDRSVIAQLRRRRQPRSAADDDILEVQ